MIETAEDVLFVPDDHYIALLKEFGRLAFGKSKNRQYTTVREELKSIERDMSAGDIIRNTRLAFNN